MCAWNPADVTERLALRTVLSLCVLATIGVMLLCLAVVARMQRPAAADSNAPVQKEAESQVSTQAADVNEAQTASPALPDSNSGASSISPGRIKPDVNQKNLEELSDLRKFVQADNGDVGIGVRYSSTHRHVTTADLPELRRMLQDTEYSEHWHNIAAIIGCISHDPQSIPFNVIRTCHERV